MLVRSLPGWAPLAALVAVSALVRFVLALDVAVPWITPDELVYGLLGRNLYETGWLGILGEPVPFYSLAYPLLVGLPLAVQDTDAAYTLLKALQAVAMSLAAVPVYLWTRELTTRGWALAAAALTLAVPGLAYAGLIMTEVAFYPVMALAAWAMARALVAPTRRNHLLLLGAIVVALATRLQAVALLPALVSALALKALFDRSWRTPRQFVPTFAGLAALAAAWAAYRLARGTSLLAAYEAAGERGYDVGEAAKFVVYHAGGVVLMTALVPVAAVALLSLDAVRGRERSEPVRAYVAVAISLAVWIVLEVGVFASEHVGRLAERDLLSLAPVVFVGFAVWLARGGPRRRVATAVTALVAAGLVLALPIDEFAVEEGLQDSFTLIPFFRLDDAAEAGVYTAAAVAAVVFALVPRRLLVALPVAVGIALAGAYVVAADEVSERSELTQRRLLGPEPRWVDRAASSDVAYLYDGEPYWNAVWEHAFWNREIERVYDLPGARVPGPMPQRFLDLEPDGTLVALDGGAPAARHVVAGTPLTFFGERVAETRQEGTTQTGLALWRLDGPARVSTWTKGVRANGDIWGEASLAAYGCEEGAFTLQLIAKGNRRVELRVDGRTWQTLVLQDGQTWGGGIPARGDGGLCTLEVSSDGLLGSTQFEFVRAA